MRPYFKPAVFGTAIALTLPAFASDITDPGTLGGQYAVAYGVNAAGDVIVGYAHTGAAIAHAFRWTAAGGMTDLGTLGGIGAQSNGINAAGDVVIGDALTGGGDLHAFRWTAAGGMTDLGTLGGSISQAYGVNAAGDVVVGYAKNGGGINHAFRWTLASNAMTDLGTLGGTTSTAYGVNAAGDVVVGASTTGAGDTRAFRWTLASSTMIDLGTLGGSSSRANGVNAAGDVIVGFSTTSGGDTHAFRWTLASSTMTDLGTLGGSLSRANGVNTVGDVIVGSSTFSSGASRAFRWTAATGMQSVEDWLAANGVTVVGVNTSSANGVNAAGNVVVGLLGNNRAFIARVADATSGSSSGAGTGLIDVQSFNEGLMKVANSGKLASNDTDTVMNGMHSNPMRMLLPNRRSTFWVAGDVGRKDSGKDDSDIGMAEVGYGYRFNDTWQLNVSAGRTYSQADTGLGGRTTARTTYLMPELIVTLPASLYVTLSGYYGQGRADIARVYLNAGTPERMSSAPGLTTSGARLRVDWFNAATLSKINFTPYASLTYLKTRTDAYIEQGGSFPAMWNQRTDKSTTARVGLDAIRPISPTTTLQGRVETAHRFEKAGAATSGQVIGLYDFGFAGQETRRNWLRLGAGVESKIGGGIASLMLNATTQGDAPSYWLAANYRWEF